jgi:hypothetical protein
MNINTNDKDFCSSKILSELRCAGSVFAVFRRGTQISCWILDSFLGDATWRGIDRIFDVGTVGYPLVMQVRNSKAVTEITREMCSLALVAKPFPSSAWREVLLGNEDSSRSLQAVIDWVKLVNDTPIKAIPISVVGF